MSKGDNLRSAQKNKEDVPLTNQELLNASYHGSFVNLARKEFSNASDSRMNKWQTYIKGDPKRQEILEVALDWVSDGHIEEYMSRHRNDTDVMGVPITFMDFYCPEQFEIVGWSRHNELNMDGGYWQEGTSNDALIDGKSVYRRILIRKKVGA